MRAVAACCTALALAIPAGALGAAEQDSDRSRGVDALFERWNRSDSPGCALGIVRNGRLIYERGYGMANLEHGIPIGPKTVFRIASTSKQFTAMALLLLAQEGRLSLDDSLRQHLPEMPEYAQRVSLRHLMHHSSGIRDYAEIMNLIGVSNEDTYLEHEVLALLARQEALNFPPGERYLYSNSNYLLLGEIVERVSGQTLRQFVDQRIFRPLEMRDSLIRDDHTEMIEHRATGYAPLEAGKFRIAESYFDLVGDGSVFTTVGDLVRWDQNFYHHAVGGPELAETQLDTLVLDNGRKMAYAAGLEVGDYGGLRLVAHSGSWVGFRAQLVRFPQQRFSVICLCNDESANPTALALRTADVYLAEEFPKAPKRPAVPDRDGQTPASARALAAKAGVYREPVTHAIARVTAVGPQLRLDRGWDASDYAPIARNNFRSAGRDVGFVSDLVFHEGERLDPVRFQLLEFAEMPLVFERIDPFSPSREQLQEYTGVYYSKEMETTHRVVLEGDGLHMKFRRSPQAPLQPTLKDLFTLGPMRIEFERDARGAVSGYGVWYDWSWNVRFVRRGE